MLLVAAVGAFFACDDAGGPREPLWFRQVGTELADWTMGMAADSQRNVWLAYGAATGVVDESVELTIVKLAASP